MRVVHRFPGSTGGRVHAIRLQLGLPVIPVQPPTHLLASVRTTRILKKSLPRERWFLECGELLTDKIEV
jgi:hypothetical protein